MIQQWSLPLALIVVLLLPLPARAQEPTPLEREVVRLANEARTHPLVYAERLERRGDTPQLREAVRALQSTQPMPPLTLSQGLSHAAADHVRDLGNRGERGHTGSDGSDPRIRMDRYGTARGVSGENISYGVLDAEGIVNQLLMSEGHRKNMLSPAFRLIGVAHGSHAAYRVMFVQTFAEGYEEASTAAAAARARQARLEAIVQRFGPEAVEIFESADDGSTFYRYEHEPPDLVMYGATWCGVCTGKARQLREQNAPHTVIYIDESQAAHDEYVALLQEAGHDDVFVPSFRFGERFVPGNPSVDQILREVDDARRRKLRRREQPADQRGAPGNTSLLPGYRPGDASQWTEVTMGMRMPVEEVGADFAQVGAPVVTLQVTTPALKRRLRLSLGVALTEHDWSYAFGGVAYSVEAVESSVSLVFLPGVRYGAELTGREGRLAVEAWRAQPYGRLGLRLFNVTAGVEAALHDPWASSEVSRLHLGAFVQWARR